MNGNHKDFQLQISVFYCFEFDVEANIIETKKGETRFCFMTNFIYNFENMKMGIVFIRK
jgi:hypothetical protein